MIRGFVPALVAFTLSSASAQANFVKVAEGTEGDLQDARLYVVDYTCGTNLKLVNDFTFDVKGRKTFGHLTLNHGVSIYSAQATLVVASGNAAAAPAGNAAAVRTPIFSTNVFTHEAKLVGVKRTAFDKASCSGQIIIRGDDVYTIDAEVGLNETSPANQILATVATLVTSTATSLYALVGRTKPAEFDGYVNNTKAILDSYESFRQIFRVENPSKQKSPGTLRIGVNWVRTFNNEGKQVSWLKLEVSPVVSLVKGKAKFLAAYNRASTKAALSLAGTAEALRKRCEDELQVYREAGFVSDFDLSYLLYRRLLSAFASKENIIQCLGRELSVVALGILKYVPARDAYLITRADIDAIAPPLPESDQPHDRALLAFEVSTFVDEFDRHLELPTGLLEPQLSKFLSFFSSQLELEDRTRQYSAFTALFSAPKTATTTVSTDEFMTAVRKAGMLRWVCVQRTKRDRNQVVPLYDPNLDSAVMVVAAIATSQETLDFNKSKYFGVHLFFDKIVDNSPLILSRMVFEDTRVQTLLKENPTCMANSPGTAVSS